MPGNGYPALPNAYGNTGLVPRGGRRRTRRTRRMRGGNIGYIPQGGEMGTRGSWQPSGGDIATRGTGAVYRGTVGGRRRRRKTRGRRTARGAFFF